MLGALCLLLFAAGANAQETYVPGDQGAVYILAPTDTINGPVTEGATINIKVRGYRYTNSRDRTFHLSYRVDDDPALDLIDAKHEGLQKYQFNVGGTDAPGVFDARGDANATLSIPTKPDARCRGGNITVTLLGSYHPLPRFVLDVAPKEYTSQLGSGSITIRVKDDPRRCPTISLDRTSAEALERDGVIEGGALEFHVARQINSGKGLDGGQVTAKWNVEDDATLDFLASADQGEKSHQFKASKVKRRQTKYVRIQTRVDRGAGNGSVKVTLQPSEYYNLTGKTTLTVPVKDDTDFLKRVLRISDLTVAEDHLYLDSTLNFINGFRLFMQLGGSPATSAQDPSVRVSFAEGGGCVATADAQDLSQPGEDGRRVPRTSFPEPMVIEWETERPAARSRHFIRRLMNDRYHEGDETLCVRFDQPKFLRLPGGVDEYFATITITDDDPPPSIKVDTPSAAEGDGALDFTVTLTNPPQGKDVTVKYHDTRRGSATSGDDYQALPKASAKGVLTFPADKGDTPQESAVSVRIIDDAEVEDEEDVALRFTEPQNADFKSGTRGVTVIGVISDNETRAPQVRLREAAPGAGPVVVQEGQTAVFHADTYIYKDGKWQIGTIDDQVLILWKVTRDQGSGGAVNRRDFPASFNRFDNIPNQDAVIDGRNGQSGVKLEVPTRSDSNEESIENFRVNLSTAYAVALDATINPANHYAVGTIYDGPTLRIAAPKGPATEGNRLKFPVTLGVAAATDISVAWKTESLAAHSAEAGKDYTAASGTLRFKAGEIDKVIRVATLEDGIDEPAEDFSVVLTDPKVAGLDLGPLRAVGIVRDNDKRPAITIGDATANEGETLNLPITLNPAPAVPVRLEWRVRAPDGHGATRGMDYTGAESGQLTFNAGESSKNLEFPTIDDSIDEPTETFEVALIVLRDEEPLFFSSQRDSAQTDILAPLTATATILDNDTPSLSIDDVEVKEGGKPVVFTVRLSSPRTYPVEVEFSTRDGGGPRVPTQIPGRFVPNTALGAAGLRQDYEGVATPRTVRFEPGTTQVKLPSIRVVDDPLPEHSEYFQGVIAFKSGITPKATIAEGVGLAKIQDNDSTRYWIANKDTTIREGRDVRIRVKRDRTGFRAQGLIGCLLPTGRHNEPGHAGMLSRAAPAPPAQIDVFIERKNNPVSVCGQATDGALPARFSFEADEDEASFWVSTVNDRRKEPDETFIVWFDPTAASGGDETSPRLARATDEVQAQTVFTILDDDDIHRFRVVSANSPWEGQDAHFDIYVDSDAGLAALKKASSPFVEIKFDADKTDTAKGGVHYTQGSLTRNFDPSSVTRKSEPVGRISIPTIGDDVLDGDRTLTISIAELLAGSSTVLPFRPASGAAAATATATIRDDEAYHLSVLDAVGDEGDAAGVKVTLSQPAEQDITIRFRTREGTAKAPADFTACAAKDARCALVIPAGETEAQLRVPTTEDAVPEETEQFRVVIVEVDFANIIVDRRTAVVKIRDDDARSVAISGLADDSVPENIAWTSPTPSLPGASDGGVAWTLEGDDAARFTIDPDTGVVTLPAQNFEAPADSDSDNVYDITVRVTDEDGNTAATALSVTVTDEVYGYLYLDARGDKVSVDPNTGLVRAEEGVSLRPSMLYGKRRVSNDKFTYDARTDKAPNRLVVSRRLTGLGGDGAAGSKDISSQAPDGAIANMGWKERDSYSRDTVTLVDDEVDEDAETFSIKYSMHVDNDDILIAIWTGSRNIISDTLKIEIIDNDTRGVTISSDTLSLEEADDPESADDKENIGTYTVVLDSQPAAGTVKVAVESGDTKAATVSPTSLTFTTTTWNVPQTVTVTAVDDATDNTGDKRSVDITHKITTTGEGNDYTAVTADPVKVTVTDDDDAPGAIALSVDTDSVDEGAGATTVTVTARITDATRFAEAKTVVVSIGGGTAVSGTDYAAVADFDVTIPAEAAAGSASFTLTPTDDDVDEADETIDVTGALTGATVTKATLSLTDDDTLGVTVTPTSKALTLAEADNGGTDAKENEGAYTVVLNSEPTADVTVAITNPPGSPVALDKTSLTFTAEDWNTAQTVTVTATDDNIDNAGDERAATLAHAVSGGGYGTAENFNVAVTVTDDDAAPTVSVGDAAAVAEGDDPETTADMTFTMTLSAASGKAVTVPYTLGGSADAGDDYTDPTTKSVTIAAGDTEADIVIAVKGDTLDEPSETVIVTLGSPTNATTEEAGTATGTITDDDATPTATLVLMPATINESGATNASTVTARLNGATSAALTLTVSAGTGVTLSTNKALTIAAGATASTGTVTLTAVNNALDAADLEVTVSATASGGNGITAPDDVTLTVTDDDAAPTVSVGDATAVAEGDDPDTTADMTFTVTLSAASGRTVTVPYTLAGSADAGDDYTDPTTKSVTIAAGATTANIVIPVKGDAIAEGNETVIVTLGSPTNATVSTTEGAGIGTGTITDDDTRGVTVTPTSKALTLAEADDGTTDSVTENEASYTVALMSEPTGSVTVAITNPRNSPVALDKASLTFTAEDWSTAQTVTVTATDDNIDNAGDERTATLAHDVSGGGYGATEDFEVAVTVTDDDAAPTALTLTVDADTGAEGVQTSVAEGGGAKTARVTATLAGATTFATATTVTVAVGAAADSATEGTDYAAVADQTLTIAAGASSGQADFTLTPTQDVLAEGAEAISLDGTATGLTVTGATLSLTDDDAAPTGITLSVSPAAVGEGAGETGVTVTATVNGATRYPDAKTVRVTVGGGTATAGTDYAAVTPFDITLAAGAASAAGTFDLTPAQDTVAEGAETIDVSGASAGLAVTKATLSLTDDDTAPTLAVADASAAEGDAVTFTVTRSGATGAAATVQWATAVDAREGAVPATAGADYTAVTTARTLSFAIGDTTATFTVATTEDTVDEPDETFLVRLTGATGAAVTDDEAVGTITDDDAAPTGIALSVNPTSVAEDAATAATVTVTATVTGGTTYAAATTVAVTVGDSADSAVSGTDYAAVSNFNITIPAGVASATGTFSLDPTDDSLAEGAETLTVSGVSGTLDVTDADITITDNESTPTATLVLTPATIDESGATNASAVTATLSAASSAALTLTVSAGAGVTVSDNKVLTIAAGETASTGTVTLTAIDNDVDAAADLSVTVSATAAGGNGVAAPADATLTITDDDTRGVTVAGAPLTLAEADDGTTDSVAENEASYTVVLDSEPTADVTVAIANPRNSPVALDKTRLTFTAEDWSTAQTVTVTATDDNIDNAGDERTATLAHAVSGGGYGASENFNVSVTVTDDDGAPTVSVGDATAVDEGDDDDRTDMTFTVALSAASGKTVTVPYTLSGTATADVDYADPATKSVTIAAGDTTADITIAVTGDEVDEPNETVVVTLGAPTNAAIASTEGAGTGTGTITDDDTRGVTVTPTSKALTLAEADDGTTESVTENEASYTVALMSEPTGSVTVAITNPRNSPVTLDTTSLTFTAATWDEPQTVTVTAADDDIDNAGDERTATLAHAVSGGGYGAAENFSVAVAVTDDDAAGFAFDPASLTVTEGGADGSYAVALTSRPTGAVTVTVSAPAGEQVTLDGPDADSAFSRSETVAFTAGNWSTAQTVTVRAEEDDDAAGGTATLSHAASGGGYGAVTGSLAVTVADDDTPGLAFAPASLTVAEGGSGSYEVALATKPSAAVTVTLTAHPALAVDTDGDAEGNQNTLSFTTDNWAAGKTVIVTAADDNLYQALRRTGIGHAASGGDYAAVTGILAVTVVDDDGAPRFAIADASAAEGEAVTFTVTRSGTTGAAATVRWATAADAREGAAPATAGTDYTAVTTARTLSFAAGETSKTFTVATTEDRVDEPDETFLVKLTGATGATVTDDEATGTITDDDAAGFAFDPASLTVTEGGADGSYAVALTSRPTGAVTVTVSAPAGEQVTLDGPDADSAFSRSETVAFTAGNWSTAQTVTVRAEEDDDAAGGTATLSHAASGGGYGAVTGSLAVTVADDDTPGLAFAPASLTVAEGGSGSYEVALATKPSAAVTVTLTAHPALAVDTDGDAEGNQNTLSFTTDNWAAGKTVIVTAADDNLYQALRRTGIGHAASGGDYAAVTGILAVTVVDDDGAPRFAIADASAAEGEAVTFTVTRSGTTGAAATVRWATAADAREGAAPATAGTDYTAVTTARTLSFAAGETSKTFTVATTEDRVDEPDETFLVRLTGATGATVSDYEATGTITDDDALGVTVAPASRALALDEADDGGTDAKENEATYTVVLDSQPTADVTVAVSNPRNSPVKLDKTSLTFTAEDWDTAQTVTVTAADDDIDNAGDERAATLAHDVSGGGYGQAQDFDVAVTVADDDDAPDGIALSVDPTSVAEDAAAAATVTVTATVSGGTTYAAATTVAVTVGDSADSAVSGTDYAAVPNFNITIPAGQASATGTFSLDPTDDSVAEGAETLTVAGAAGTLDVTDAEVTIADDEGTPTATLALTPATIDESGATNASAVTATLSGATSAALTLTVSAGAGVTASANKVLTIAAGETASTGTVTLTAIDNNVDAADLEVTVSATAAGGNGVAAPASVTLTVTDDDTRGVTVSPASKALTLDEADDGTTDSVTENEASYTVVLMSEPTGSVTVAITNPRNSPVTLDKTRLTFTTGNWNEPQTVTVAAVDDAIDNTDDKRTATLAHAVSGGGYGAGEDFEVAVTVTDDDAAPTALTLTVDADTGAEGVQTSVAEDGGAKTARVTATLAGATTFATATTVTVAVGAAADSATEGTDYAAVADQTLTIAAGASSGQADFTLTPTQDVLAEGAEAISLDGTATGLTVTGATLSLTDDDAAPTGITLSVSPAAVGEGAGETGVTVTAAVNGATRYPDEKTVRVTVGGGTAISGTDYAAVAAFDVTIGAGAASAQGTFDLTPTQDTLYEGDETIDVSGASAGLAVAKAEVSITDDDGAPSLAIADASAAEGDALTFTVTRSGATGAAASVQWATAADAREGATQATAGTDYTAVTTARTLSFAEGDTTKTFTVATTEDTVDEPDETFAVELSGATGATISDAAAIGTITDDDAAPTGIALSMNPTSVAENAATAARVTVTATVAGGTTYAAATAVTVSVGDGSDSAVSGTDYAAVSDVTITIPAGTASATGTFSLDPTDDSLAEGAETLTVAGAAGTLDVTDAEVTITDDDAAPSAFTLAVDADTGTNGVQTSVAEGGGAKTARVTATLGGTTAFATDREVTVKVGKATDTATEGTDYATVADLTITIAAGASSAHADFTLTPTDDAIDEANESISVEGSLGDIDASGPSITITDDDATPTATLALDPATIDESGATNASAVTARLSAASSAALTLTVSAGTGVTLSDNKTLTIAAGETASTGVVTLTAIDNDVDAAADLSVTVSATASGGNGVANPANVTLTITDDDDAAITLMPSSIEIPMGGQRAYQVMLSSEPSTTVKVAIEESVDGYVTCAPQELEFTLSDWMKPKTVMVTANGASNGDFVVQAQDDEEGMDSLELLHTASGNEYEGVKAEMSVEVLRTESVIPDSLAISVDDAEGPEGDWLEFRVHLSQPSPGGVRVKYRTTSGEAWGLRVPRDDGVNWDERDYDTVDGVLRFDVGEQEKIVRVWARADDGHYDPGETFFFDIYDPVGVTLANPNNEYPLPLAPEVMGRVGINSADGKLVWASSRMSRAIGTITGEMPDPLEVSISVNRDVVTEGDDYTIIRVTATAPYGARRSIRIPLTCGGGSAEADDFVCPTGLTIHHGDNYGQAGFDIRQDDDTDDETFTIAIGEPLTTDAAGTNATFVRGAAASVDLTVLDDDSGSVGNDPYDGLTVSIADATAQEGTEDLWFEVTLNRPAPGPVTFHAESESGTARSPNDYQYLNRREIRFEEGERLYRLPVWVHDDDINEGSETMTVKLENPQPANVVIARAVATGTIKNSDPIPGGWLARFGRTVADQAIDGVTDRLRAPRTPGFEGSLSFPGSGGYRAGEPGGDAENGSSMAGAPSPVHAAAGRRRGGSAASAGGTGLPMPFERPPDGHGGGTAGEELSSEKALLRQLSTGSFIHTLEADSAGGTLAWWGKGSQSQFSGRDRSLSLDGDVLTLTLGADYGRGPWVAGAGLLHSIGRGEWSGVGGGELEASLTSVAPYAAWSLGERLQLWSAAGLGMGSLGVALGEGVDRAERIDTDMGWRMAAAGARGDLLAGTGEGDLAVAVIADAMWSETSSARAAGLVAARAAVSRLRLGLEGSLRARLGSGVSLAPKLELGVRQDGGDAETGRGIYAGAGLALTDPNLGIAFDLEGQTLISHDDETFREWGMSASLKFDPRPDSEYGLSLALRQDRGGASSGGMQAILSPDTLPISGFASGSGAADWTVEMSYGLPAFGERFTATPRLSYGLGTGNQEYGLGWQLDPAEGAPDLKLGMRAKRRESIQAPPDHGIEIEAIVRW